MISQRSSIFDLRSVFHEIDYSALGLVLLLNRMIFISFMGSASVVVGFNTKTTSTIYYLLIWLLFVLGVKKNGYHPTKDGNMFFACVLLFGVIMIPFSSMQYIWDTNLESFITFNSISYLSSSLYIPLALSINNISKLRSYLTVFARLFIFLVVINDYFSISVLSTKQDDDMMYSYGVVLTTCVLINEFMNSHKKFDLTLLLLGVLSALLSGTRGPLVCIAACFLFSYIQRFSKISSQIIAILALAFFSLLGGFKIVMNLVALILTKFGFGGIRLMQYMSDDMLMDSSGRDDIASTAWSQILSNGFIGGGIGGDRQILGFYVHNLFLELLCDFGLLFGCILIIFLAHTCFKYINSSNKSLSSIGIILISTFVVELMFSSSYLIVFELFLLLALYYNNRSKSIISQDYYYE